VSVINILFGGNGEQMFALLVVFSSLGAINAMIITGSRITYAMAKDNPFFDYLSEIDSRRGTPIRAIVINTVWSAGLILWGDFHKLLYLTGIVFWLFFALVVIGLFILRRKHPNIDRPFSVWGYPIVPVVFIACCLLLMVNTLIFSPVESVLGLSLMLSGIPVYYLTTRKRRSPEKT
jgi:APA family basic amino acid/polyamine antiporter